MPITFENDNDVIIYALEKIISHARRIQHIFVAQCVWWLASVIGLEVGLIIHINQLHDQEAKRIPEGCNVIAGQESEESSREITKEDPLDRVDQVSIVRDISTTPRDLMEDQRLDQRSEDSKASNSESSRARNIWQRNRVNPLPISKTQLKKARKLKRLQDADKDRSQRLHRIRAEVISNLCKE
jgi:hypothetical protein